MASNKKMILGITGGIAAYKTPDLIRLLKKTGIDVQVIITRSAEQFVTPTVLRTVSNNQVLTSDWNTQEDPFTHLSVTKGISVALIAPATANFLGKLAHGVADDLLLTTMLAVKCPIYVAPAMNPAMYTNSAVVDNLKTLEKRGVTIISPDIGEMACGDIGEGRMPPIDKLVAIIKEGMGLRQDLLGKRIIVTAGPTEEPIDAVRFISNRSTGKMGVALAEAALDRGAEVTLIHGPISVTVPKEVRDIPVRQAKEMMEEVRRQFEICDILIMAAAVSDFRPTTASKAKIKKTDAERHIALEATQDILETLGKSKGNRIIVGFAAETEDFMANARQKMIAKNLDMICVNDVSRNDIGFGSNENEITLLNSSGYTVSLGKCDKLTMSYRILDQLVSFINPAGGLNQPIKLSAVKSPLA
jgi:phosphopantothenoylcysteine decarboxylase/phosphopantothenate--cysteine ligase